ncbi:MAG TPA: amidohydrolase family protein, partial [Thermoplasmata archaeon]|nr:amidohydrolase family protein [Thermoplasmata archaeon]
LFALHASERVREDVDGVLDLRPDLLVHLTEATDGDLDRVSDAHVPVAVCPRSNAFFGKVLDLPRMVRAGLRLFLGTDNAMVNGPSMLRELEFAWKIARLRGGVKPRAILEMALRGRAGLAGRGDKGLVPGAPADLLVLRVPGGRPTFGGVFRAIETDIVFVSAGGRAWVRAGHGATEVFESAAPRKRPRKPRDFRRR